MRETPLIGTAALRIASVPSGHPYVEHLVDAEPGGVVHLPDPPPVGGGSGRWWPPTMLTPAWITEHAHDFDVLHVHFGMESFSTSELEAALSAVAASGRPLVYTVHDLSNPQLVDQTRHREHVDLMIERADRLITLTGAAADLVERRWHRRPVVIEHPHVLPLDRRAPVGTAHPTPVVGVHLRDLRPNIDGVTTVSTLGRALEMLHDRGSQVVGRLDLNENVRDEETRDAVREIADASPWLTLHEHPRWDDDALERSLADLDVALLPYGHGTHSGWVELCFDLGVPVVGAGVGFMGEQHPDSFRDYRQGDATSLASALAATIATESARPGSDARRELVARRHDFRVTQRSRVAAQHEELYRELAR